MITLSLADFNEWHEARTWTQLKLQRRARIAWKNGRATVSLDGCNFRRWVCGDLTPWLR